MSERYAGRSIHGAPQHARRFAENPILRVEGGVARSLELNSGDLATFDRARFLDLDRPDVGHHWPENDWSGVRISDLIASVGVAPDARWIHVLGGPMASVLTIDQAESALICDQMNGDPIPVELGGPFRLVSPDLRYNLAVKWVERIVLTVLEPDRSAERIAIARQRARDARK